MLLTPQMRDALTYFGCLFGTSALVWLAFVALGPDGTAYDPLALIIWWFWLAPLPYLLAWFLLVVPSLKRALTAFAAVAVANLLMTIAGLLVGGFSLGLLALPAIVVAGRALGFVVALGHARAVGWLDWGAWRRIHVKGGTWAGVGLALALVAPAAVSASATAGYREWLVFGAVSALGFRPHAVAARRKLQADGSAIAPPARMVVLLAIAYLVPMLGVWSALPPHRAMVWPLHLFEAAAAVSAGRKADHAVRDNLKEEAR